MIDFDLTGLVPPVFTPFNHDGSINFAVIPGYVEYLAKRNITGILVGGTSGEGMSLSVAERKRLTEAWVAAARPYHLHVMVQAGGAPLPDVLEVARHAQEAGADSVLTLPELYFKPATPEELVEYVALVAAAAPRLPVLYYHIPANTNVAINMPAFVTAAAKKISNFRGIKFTSNDLNEGQAVLKNLEQGHKVYLGADTLLASAAVVGFDSSIGTTYNFAPELAAQILDAVVSGNVHRAGTLQRKLNRCVEVLTAEGGWVPVMKVGMEVVTGIKVGPPRRPLKPISPEQRLRIEAGLQSLGLIG